MYYVSIILPLVLGIIQIIIVRNYLIKIRSNKELSSYKKEAWTNVVIFVPFLGLLVYLICSIKTHKGMEQIEEFDYCELGIKDAIQIFLFYVFTFLCFAILYFNPNHLWITLLLSFSLIIFISIQLFGKVMYSFFRIFLPPILVFMLTVVQYMSATNEYGFIILIAVASIIIEYPMHYSRVFFPIPLLMFLLGSAISILYFGYNMPPNYLLEFVFARSVSYIMVAGSAYFIKRQLVMNNYLAYLMNELENKTEELEQASIIEERNRIAREIHDSLGHTLTGAIIQLEVAKQLIDSSPEKAKISIQKTQDITRDGFNDVKRAIKALRPVMIEDNTLAEALKIMTERVKNYYNYSINSTICLPRKVDESLKIFVYRLVQELITNSIRHGQASWMDLTIEEQDNTIIIICNDNGRGCCSIHEGNGLKGIKERAEQLGGNVSYSSKVDEGFYVSVSIPVN